MLSFERILVNLKVDIIPKHKSYLCFMHIVYKILESQNQTWKKPSTEKIDLKNNGLESPSDPFPPLPPP